MPSNNYAFCVLPHLESGKMLSKSTCSSFIDHHQTASQLRAFSTRPSRFGDKQRQDSSNEASSFYFGTWYCRRDGRLPSRPGAKQYHVKIKDPQNNQVYELDVPEDRYIWFAMEDAGIDLPAACRNGCCTTCAVKIEKGDVEQVEALGLMKSFRKQGYALLCVSYPRADLEAELQDEDEVYVKQFGSSFEAGGIEWGGVLPEDD